MSRQYLKIIFIVKSQKPDTMSDTMAAGGAGDPHHVIIHGIQLQAI